MENDLYRSPPYKRAHFSHVTSSATAYIVELLTQDVFLSSLLLRLGLPASTIGVISSLISFSFLVQLLTIPLLQKRISYKKFTVVFKTVGLTGFGILFLLPFSPGTGRTVQIIAMMLVLFSNVSEKLISGIGSRWFNEFVDPRRRGRYSAVKEAVSLVVGIFVTLLSGYAFTALSEQGRMDLAFLLFAVLILLNSLLTFVCCLLIPEADIRPQPNAGLADAFRHTLLSPRFRPVLVMTVMYEISRYFTLGFLGTFKTEDLGISVFAVEIINVVSGLIRLAFTPFFGKYSDKKTFAGGFELSLWFSLAAFACLIFTTKSTWYLIILFSVLYQIAMAGVEQNLFNICYSYVDRAFLTQAMIIRSSIGGLFGFLSSFIAGRLFDPLAQSGLPMAPQQVLAAITCVSIVGTILYSHFRVRPIPVSIQ